MAATDVYALLAELDQWASANGGAVQTHRYGPDPEHEADLRLPAGEGPHRVAVLLHGGFWRAPFKRSILSALAVDLTNRGWATWNVEYRRIGSGGGAAETLADVRRAIDELQEVQAPLRARSALVIGHSAGGQLALCAASLPTIAAAVSLGGVCDMTSAADQGIGEHAVLEFIGATPRERPDAYDLADPMRRLPTRTRTLLVHGDADNRVPVQLSRNYAAAARAAGDDCELLELEGVDHFMAIDPRTSVWSDVADRLAALLD